MSAIECKLIICGNEAALLSTLSETLIESLDNKQMSRLINCQERYTKQVKEVLDEISTDGR